MAIAAAVVLAVVGGIAIYFKRANPTPQATPISAALDPYSASLPMSNLAMSEAANLAGSKVTYLDGRIANTGNRTVTGVTVQVLFRDPAREVAQNETQPLKLITMRQPYIDVQPVSSSPIKPGDQRDFRLIFDTVAQDWDGAYPEVRIVRVESR